MHGDGMRPLLSLIAVISADGFISADEGVPWDLPKDKAHFRSYTHGKWLLLGRKTYEEMLGWFSDHYPLVMSRDEKFIPFLGERVTEVGQALAKAEAARQPELVVVGGSAAFDAAMPLADRLIITHVEQRLGSGVPFPPFSEEDWVPVSREEHERDELHAWRFAIVVYQRVKRLPKAA